MAEAVRLEITVDDKGSPVIRTVTDNLDKLARQSARTATEHVKLNQIADQAVGIFGRMGGQIGGAASAIAGALGPMGGFAVAIGAAALAGKDTIDTLKTLAFQTRDLAFLSGGTAEQVSGLIDVLEDYGVEAETVNRSMNFLSKAVQEGSPALDRLGISIRSSSGHLKTAHDLFYEVVDALHKMRSETDRNATGQEIFGKQWINLIPAIQQGSAALRDAAEASKLSMSKEDLARVEEYRKVTTELGDQFDRLKLLVGRGLILPVTVVLKWMGDAGELANALAAPHRGGGVDAAERARILENTDPTGRIRAGLPDRSSGDMGAWRMGGAGVDVSAASPVAGETPGEKKAREAREKAAEAEKKAAQEIWELQSKGWVAYVEALEKQWDLELKIENEGHAELYKLLDKAKVDEQAALVRIAEFELDLAEKTNAALNEVMAQAVADRKEARKNEYESIKAQAEWNAQVQQEADELTSKYQLEQYSKRRAEFDSLFEPVSRALEGSLQGILQGTQTVEEAMRRMGQNIAASLFETIVEKGLKKISEALFTFLDSLGGSSGAASWISKLFSAIGGAYSGSGAAAGSGGIFPGHFTPIHAFAGGGIADRPTIGLIGEGAYAEAIVPLPDGRSIPAKITGGGGPIQINIDARRAERGVSPEIMAAIRTGMNQAVHLSLARVSDERRRGGMRGLA